MDRYVHHVNDATRIVLDQPPYPTGSRCAGYANNRRLDQPLLAQTSAFKSPNYAAGADDSGFSEPSMYIYTDGDEHDAFSLRGQHCVTSGSGSTCSTPNREVSETHMLPPFEIPDSSPIPNTPFQDRPSRPAFPVALALEQNKWSPNDITRFYSATTNRSPPILRIFGLFGKYMPFRDNNNNTVNKIKTNGTFGSTSAQDLSLNKLRLIPKTVTFPNTCTSAPTTGAIASILNSAPLNATGRSAWEMHHKISPERNHTVESDRNHCFPSETDANKIQVSKTRQGARVISQKCEFDALRNQYQAQELPVNPVKRKLYTDTQVFSDISDTESPLSGDHGQKIEPTQPQAPVLREIGDVCTSGGNVSYPSDASSDESCRHLVQSTNRDQLSPRNMNNTYVLENRKVTSQISNVCYMPVVKTDGCHVPTPVAKLSLKFPDVKIQGTENERTRIARQNENSFETRLLDNKSSVIRQRESFKTINSPPKTIDGPKARSRGRKCFIPTRGASRFDPKFRGATIWIQTDFHKGVSRLHISAFYNNVAVRRRRRGRSRTYRRCMTPAYNYSETDDNVATPARDYHVTVKTCASCKTRRTPLWRDSEDGTPLCNACGIRYKKYRLRCSRCWHIPKKDVKTYPHCPVCAALLRYSFHKKTAAW